MTENLVGNVLAFGPRRVVVDAEGTARSPKRALRDHGITPDVIFVRKDGWALGAPHRFVKVAQSMAGPTGWLAVIEHRTIVEFEKSEPNHPAVSQE